MTLNWNASSCSEGGLSNHAPIRPKGPAIRIKSLTISWGEKKRVGFFLWIGALHHQDKEVGGMKGRLARNANIDLGLAILASTSEPPHTCKTIAAYCGCSRQRIQQIEQKALRKLRATLDRDGILREAFETEFQGLLKK